MKYDCYTCLACTLHMFLFVYVILSHKNIKIYTCGMVWSITTLNCTLKKNGVFKI